MRHRSASLVPVAAVMLCLTATTQPANAASPLARSSPPAEASPVAPPSPLAAPSPPAPTWEDAPPPPPLQAKPSPTWEDTTPQAPPAPKSATSVLVAPISSPAATRPPRVPLARRWWFWASLGAAALGVVIAGIALTPRQPYSGDASPGIVTVF